MIGALDTFRGSLQHIVGVRDHLLLALVTAGGKLCISTMGHVQQLESVGLGKRENEREIMCVLEQLTTKTINPLSTFYR